MINPEVETIKTYLSQCLPLTNTGIPGKTKNRKPEFSLFFNYVTNSITTVPVNQEEEIGISFCIAKTRKLILLNPEEFQRLPYEQEKMLTALKYLLEKCAVFHAKEDLSNKENRDPSALFKKPANYMYKAMLVESKLTALSETDISQVLKDVEEQLK